MPRSGLESFLHPVRAWFETTFGVPTPPQAQGWSPIQRGEHTLILAPTGSGKTLSAFLWGIDQLFRELTEATSQPTGNFEDQVGIRLVYISPLKALNNDIHRNLRVPLEGIRTQAEAQDLRLPEIRVAVRSGDTPQRERQAMLREPPHILITTPESLYLLLTSPKARELFRNVRTVIVDEIHTLVGNKRGVHLALSLERLQHLVSDSIQRIGLSATIEPLDEAARFLGGYEWREDAAETKDQGAESAPPLLLAPRPVTIVNAAYQKSLDLRVVTTVDDFRNLPGKSVWPSIIPQVLDLIRSHQTTLVFTNNRRLAERTGDYLNEQWFAEGAGKTTGLIRGDVVTGIGMMATGDGTRAGPVRVHHGSVAKEARLELERQLKAGELPALVGTSSLELGIDIGAVDLVVQLQSPKSVAQGLQRVGRSGHLVGQTSVGRIFPTHREDVVEAAAISGGMLRGEVEPTRTPRHPLDVLAQHIVAMVSVEPWRVEDFFALVRCAYPYTDLSARALQTTLEMLAGRYPSQAYRELRARLDWDRVNDKLAPLPGSRMLALTNGGTIPNTGAFGAYLGDGKTKLGELDEEFVFETRIGDTLMLGSQVWRVIDVTDDRVIVSEAPGAIPRMPFWRGDFPWRPYELGKRVGAFRRAVVERLQQARREVGLEDLAYREMLRMLRSGENGMAAEEIEVLSALRAAVEKVSIWLSENYALDARSAWHILDYLAGQLDQTDGVASDRMILVEVFDDALGDPRLVIHSPFGGRVNGPWGLALASALRERAGIQIEVETNDDGILLRLLDSEAEFPLDIVTDIGPAEARERILRELPESAVFGARFRQNAARALLLPGVGKGKRTPFWLQRLRARDLLQVVRKFEDFPIIAETYRDCLQDVLDLPHLEEVLTGIQQGAIGIEVIESATPSPVAQSLLWDFVNTHMYEWDAPKAEQQLQLLAVNRDLLQDLLKDVALDELLRPEAIDTVRGQLQHTLPTARVRNAAELAVLLQQLGDLSSSEIAQRATIEPSSWIAELTGEGRLIGMEIPTVAGVEWRWVLAELVEDYRAAFVLPQAEGAETARRAILQRFLANSGPVTLEGIRARYAFPEDWLQVELDHLIEGRDLVHGRFTQQTEAAAEFVDRRALEQIHRRTLHILRQEVQPAPFTLYADFLARWQHLHPAERLAGASGLTRLLQQLRAAPVVGRIWERDVLALRLLDYDPVQLEALFRSGDLVWIGAGGTDPRRARVRLLFRGEGNVYLEPAPADLRFLSETARSVYDFLKSEGASFYNDIIAALEFEAAPVQGALIELTLAGLVTTDSLDVLRRLMKVGRPQPQSRQTYSSLEVDLAQRREALGLNVRAPGRKPDLARYRSGRDRVRERVECTTSPRGTGPWSQGRWTQGRWSPLHRFSVLGKALPAAERVAQQTRQLLSRYGVVTHECLEGEIGAWDWSLIYSQLQRLELRGEVRRGYFVQGLSGVQFALPEVVERLRALRDTLEEAPVPVVLNACDPANLWGATREGGALTVQGEPLTFARVPSIWLVQVRGFPVLVAMNGGAELLTAQGTDDLVLQQALRALFLHLGQTETRVLLQTWNGEPVLESPGKALLEAVGAIRYYPGMAWERH